MVFTYLSHYNTLQYIFGTILYKLKKNIYTYFLVCFIGVCYTIFSIISGMFSYYHVVIYHIVVYYCLICTKLSHIISYHMILYYMLLMVLV